MSPPTPQTPIKKFYLPLSPLLSLLHLPSQILFAITGLFGLASYPRQIVNIKPRSPALLTLNDGREVNLLQWVERNVGSLKGFFKPTWWLPNGHLQTMYSVVGDFTKIDKVEYIRTYLRAPDGGTIGLDFAPLNHAELPESTPTIVVCHGLTGGSHESYVRNVLAWVIKPVEEGGLGVRAVVVNFRGCAGVPLTSPRLYSAGTTTDLTLTLHYLRHTYPTSPLHGLGFSLGASVISNYSCETTTSSLLSSACILGTPWDLSASSVTLEFHWFISRVYFPAMGKNLLKLFFKYYDANPNMWDRLGDDLEHWERCLGELKAMRKRGRATLKEVDERMVRMIGGPIGEGLWPMGSAQEYYSWASSYKRIEGVSRPTLAINAFDDPICDGDKLPITAFQSAPYQYTAITGGGGHLGWFEGPRAKSRWVLKPVSEFLIAATRDLGVEGIRQVEVEFEDGWEWVKEEGHPMQGGGRIGWRVLKEGEIVEGGEESGALQGL